MGKELTVHAPSALLWDLTYQRCELYDSRLTSFKRRNVMGKISVLVCTKPHTDEQSAGSQPLLYGFRFIFTMNSRQHPVTSSHQNPDKSGTEEMLTCLFESALVSLQNVLEATRLRSSNKCSAALF